MPIPNTIRDPLGNQVLLNPAFEKDAKSMNQIRQIIASPAFIITGTDGSLYFIRKINPRLNKLIEAKCTNTCYTVHALIDNPSPEYISTLLKKGRLISFH